MDTFWLGLGLGLATIVPPGPIAMTLVGVATRRGSATALRGAAGIAAGDLTGAAVAVATVTAGAALPDRAFGIAQIVAASILVALGVTMLLRPSVAETLVDRIRHPARTLFLLTSLAPHALASWIALFAAMPFAASIDQLATFALGVVLASACWHPVLALVSTRVAAIFGPRIVRPIALVGGGAMSTMGLVAAGSLIL